MDHLFTVNQTNWNYVPDLDEEKRILSAFEKGKVIYFPSLAFGLLPHELAFLTPQALDGSSKNISFDLSTHTLKGTSYQENEKIALAEMMNRFALQSQNLMGHLFPHYMEDLVIKRTSFRPAEISARSSSYRKDDTRLHVDAFPSTPNQGRRIVRFFSNINPTQGRVWRLGEPFEDVARYFLPKTRPPFPLSSWFLKSFGVTRTKRTSYDHYMLRLHNAMKADLAYQRSVPQETYVFPPYSSWIVMTDSVSHAAMAGQHVLEQTFELPVEAMYDPSLSPLKILERLKGRPLH
jgi:hypothetical protein